MGADQRRGPHDVPAARVIQQQWTSHSKPRTLQQVIDSHRDDDNIAGHGRLRSGFLLVGEGSYVPFSAKYRFHHVRNLQKQRSNLRRLPWVGTG